MLINLQNLTKEDRIKKLIEENMNKSAGFNVSILNPNDFNIVELHTIFSQIEDRIYYITQAPSFDFKGSTRMSETRKFNDIDHIIKSFNQTPSKFLIFYSMFKSPLMQPNNHQDIMIRGSFIDDPTYFRNRRIDEVLS
jgi:hypothetical protein